MQTSNSIYRSTCVLIHISWSKHIEEMCRNACKQVGIIYRQFYGHSSLECLRQLYISLVRSKLEYAAPVWDPHQKTNSHKIEKVQKFALKICTKLWNMDDSLLYRYCGPTVRIPFYKKIVPEAIIPLPGNKW